MKIQVYIDKLQKLADKHPDAEAVFASYPNDYTHYGYVEREPQAGEFNPENHTDVLDTNSKSVNVILVN